MKRYIMLIGGNLVNKGAEAMTFLAISELKKRFPDHEPVLMSANDYQMPESFKQQYSFLIEDMNIACWCKKRPIEFLPLAFVKKLKPATLKRFNEILDNTDMAIDISGYHLSSSFGVLQSLLYLYRIDTIKRKGIPYYIFPQTIGPFDYVEPFGKYMRWKIKRTLRYPKNIWVREQDGYNLLTKQLGIENVCFSKDMVLTGGQVDYRYIFSSSHKQRQFQIRDNSIGILPNRRAFSANSGNDLLNIYRSCIDALLEQNKNVDILAHSREDLKICYSIKEMYPDNDSVRVLEDCLDSVEFSEVVTRYDFLIASRYHSIVHAYKKGTPCLALGWSYKYIDLLSDFSQRDYYFDVREKIEVDAVKKQLGKLLGNYTNESNIIKNILSNMPRMDIFNELKME